MILILWLRLVMIIENGPFIWYTNDMTSYRLIDKPQYNIILYILDAERYWCMLCSFVFRTRYVKELRDKIMNYYWQVQFTNVCAYCPSNIETGHGNTWYIALIRTVGLSAIYGDLYHNWVWNRGICMCVIVRPRSHMLIVLKKVIPDTTRYDFA